jgi:hypothetical protein
MRNLESSKKKTKGKSEKLPLLHRTTLDSEPIIPDNTLSKNGSIPESELFVDTDPAIEKKAIKILMNWKIPVMCPEFGL